MLYARAKAKLWSKVERLRKLEACGCPISARGGATASCGSAGASRPSRKGSVPSFTGTSNVLLAMDNDLEAIGTNAHELPMVAAALANDDKELRWAPYRILDQWRHTYGGNLLIALPDAFGTKAFLRDAPEWVADWTGFRPDSAPPIAAGEEIIKWWKQKGRDPREKLLVFSDGMDVGSIEETYRHFAGRVRISFGWGTNLTNDFVGCAPDGSADLDPISIVCKVTSVDGRPAVKLSDNPEKATGSAGRSRALSARVRQCRPRPHRGACVKLIVSRTRCGILHAAPQSRDRSNQQRHGAGSTRPSTHYSQRVFQAHGCAGSSPAAHAATGA